MEVPFGSFAKWNKPAIAVGIFKRTQKGMADYVAREIHAARSGRSALTSFDFAGVSNVRHGLSLPLIPEARSPALADRRKYARFHPR
jgi:hypothetical protein